MPLKDRDAIRAELQEIEAVLRSDIRRHRIFSAPATGGRNPLESAGKSSSRRYILPSPRSRLQPTAPSLRLGSSLPPRPAACRLSWRAAPAPLAGYRGARQSQHIEHDRRISRSHKTFICRD